MCVLVEWQDAILRHVALWGDRDPIGPPQRFSSKFVKCVVAPTPIYDFAEHLEALQWRTPFQVICDAGARAVTAGEVGCRWL